MTYPISGTANQYIALTLSETQNAQKTVPRAMFMSLVAVAVIYTGMCAAISAAAPYVLNADKTNMVVTGTSVLATCPAIAGYIGGSMWGSIFTACVVASIVGCGFGFLLTFTVITDGGVHL